MVNHSLSHGTVSLIGAQMLASKVANNCSVFYAWVASFSKWFIGSVEISMRILLIVLLSLVSFSSQALAEQSYLMVPDAVEQTESIGKAAERVGRRTFQSPRTAGEAMGRLRSIDHDLSRIIHLSRRFQSTSQMLDKGLNDIQRFAEENQRLAREWGPAMQGNYRLIQTVFTETGRNDIRTLTTLMILENIMLTLDERKASLQKIRHIELKYSLEAQTINAARQRLHKQLLSVGYELKDIRNKAQSNL